MNQQHSYFYTVILLVLLQSRFFPSLLPETREEKEINTILQKTNV